MPGSQEGPHTATQAAQVRSPRPQHQMISASNAVALLGTALVRVAGSKAMKTEHKLCLALLVVCKTWVLCIFCNRKAECVMLVISLTRPPTA